MSKIDVNIDETRLANSRLPFIRDNINNIVSQLIHLRSAIDPRVLNQNNLRVRLNNSCSNIASIEDDLRNLNATITSILNRYENTDQILLSRVPTGGLMGSSGSSRNVNAFTLDATPNITAANRVATRVESSEASVQTGAITTGGASSATPGIIKRINNANISDR